MAEEKILEEKAVDEELMNEEELDKVAGGTSAEINDDRARLIELGFYKKAYQTRAHGVGMAFKRFGEAYGMKVTFKARYGDDAANTYYVNDKEISREKLWEMIDTLTSK